MDVKQKDACHCETFIVDCDRVNITLACIEIDTEECSGTEDNIPQNDAYDPDSIISNCSRYTHDNNDLLPLLVGSDPIQDVSSDQVDRAHTIEDTCRRGKNLHQGVKGNGYAAQLGREAQYPGTGARPFCFEKSLSYDVLQSLVVTCVSYDTRRKVRKRHVGGENAISY